MEPTMNWDAIGAIGELIGAAAVVITLAFLAYQVSTAFGRAIIATSSILLSSKHIPPQ